MKADILELISEHIPLSWIAEEDGHSIFAGKCPFCKKENNLVIYTDKQQVRCLNEGIQWEKWRFMAGFYEKLNQELQRANESLPMEVLKENKRDDGLLGSIRARSEHSWRIEIRAGKDSNGKHRRYTETVRGSRDDAIKRLRELQPLCNAWKRYKDGILTKADNELQTMQVELEKTRKLLVKSEAEKAQILRAGYARR